MTNNPLQFEQTPHLAELTDGGDIFSDRMKLVAAVVTGELVAVAAATVIGQFASEKNAYAIDGCSGTDVPIGTTPDGEPICPLPTIPTDPVETNPTQPTTPTTKATTTTAKPTTTKAATTTTTAKPTDSSVGDTVIEVNPDGSVVVVGTDGSVIVVETDGSEPTPTETTAGADTTTAVATGNTPGSSGGPELLLVGGSVVVGITAVILALRHRRHEDKPKDQIGLPAHI